MFSFTDPSPGGPTIAPAPRRERIAVLGGGMASLTAAFALTETPALRDRYEITVYQDGWLLGGKGASVRNRAMHGRIEEHGLHLWLGYYENAFTLLRKCYDELGRPAGAAMATLREAFLKHSAIVVEEKTPRGWEHWSVSFPQTDEWPGDGRPLPSFAESLRGGVRQVLIYARAFFGELGGPRPEVDDAAAQLRGLLDPALAPGAPPLLGAAARALAEGLWALMARLWTAARRDVELDPGLRRLWVVFNFLGAVLVGALRDGLVGPDADFEALDDIEFSDWLRRHGASEVTLSSGLVRAFYHLAFCDGDGAGAGLALLGMMRMFTCYRGAVFYKMRAGMGETVFSPLYEVLRRRGVRFEFFHRVRGLELSTDRRAVERVVIGRQATPRSGEYHPLIDVGGLPCWPEAPLYEQLVEGEELARRAENLASFWSDWPDVEQRILERGAHFDHVLLGISIGALPSIAPELIEASPRWRRMIEHVKTVRTVSLQLWVSQPVGRLGTSAHAPVVGAYRVPLETWADMSHLVPVEGWRAGEGVQGILYACGQLGHGDDPIAAGDPRVDDLAALERTALDFLEKDLGHIWPAGREVAGGVRWDALFDPDGRAGAERLRAQYLRVNASPSDRYVLSVPGSQKPERLVWFLPHVFVSTGAAAAAGREIYGFAKSVVDVEVRRTGYALDRLSVVGEVIARHASDARGGPGRILEVTRRDAGPIPPRARAVDRLFFDAPGPLGGLSPWLTPISRRLAANEVTLAFLKQFRDVERTDRACYQAIVEAKARVTALRGFGPLPGTLRVDWDDHDSHPFSAELGLAPGGQEALAAAWVDFDFVMESGREVFNAARDGGRVARLTAF
ncbi:NAD(P)-binding protein [Sorangium sp. So ce1024]|uniref:NAD(P)-binding protein n=1 Tax=unclassified Sorangium TaxID=2621164 RepID=UPI003F0D5AB4